MRPYRGIPIDGKEFVYGWYVNSESNKRAYIVTSATGYDESPTELEHLKAHGKIYIHEYYRVIPETVGQFTGLKDKDREDTDIYQGDVFRGKESGIILLVDFQEGEYILTKKVDYAPHRIKHADLHFALNNIAIEYVGNFHQHPNLLEQDK